MSFTSPRIHSLLLLLALSALQMVSAGLHADDYIPPSEWSGVSQVVAVGDLHGSYEKALELFRGAGLIDEDDRWTGGDKHLVTAGDLLDRGIGDRPLMDLMMRLQAESEAAGGRVHVLLGNHEAMNLMRDLRYVNPKSFAAWAEDETEAERKKAWRDYVNSRPGNNRKSQVVSDFQRDYPPGYFARQRSFDVDGQYGKWLLRRPAAVKINGVIFVHGGLTVDSAVRGLDELNGGVLRDLRRHLEAREVLTREGLVTPVMDLAGIIQIAKAGMQRPAGTLPPTLYRAAQEVMETFRGPFLGSDGPLWYRGNSFEDERIEQEMLERSLELLGARAMVVAHSPTSNRRITSRFHGKLFRVDHNIGESERLQALVVQADDVVVLEADTNLTMRPVVELPIGRHKPRDPEVVSDRDLRDLLAEGEIVAWRFLGRGTTRPRLLELESNGVKQRAIFKDVDTDGDGTPQSPPDRFQHELAAYRLDRAIGFDLVPVTVLRNVDGLEGSVQEWVEGAVDKEAAEAYELGLFSSQTVRRQLRRAEVFDALIGNFDRKPDDILSLVQGDRVYLIDHSKAFTTATDIEWTPGDDEPLEATVVQVLENIDRSSLQQELGELLSEEQIDALLVRRDKILERVAHEPT